ncbi:uncharacterized protein OCT59_022288 [Rhizophagus irregularis]|uniref:P-loop containing nucleoside triphosphate hydrolase protein n=2 Tax=Rhizophagus irregularis TaxID=588596 RepID=A0A015KG30_RHIIW|nr:hypothetical protein GLOIN_2v1482767 [Rhizophagus irregularis DAOM 181602=DAOM 197198]EXX58576.1 hypothetical protein RirG_196680 [Rhizophagus irregularis DAOM 197198w]POG65924.1 hypothetical protein GLOIN_2v1482767 [Rhizophagus irregularis DAOM 181602=DAOM 197198]UZO28776.1 hypothetical protein OCT59_022288 [Rhizophagus irregularis]GBC52095.1 P-loop containing nucleoside triphosphate hydrolase protein [Rhizophagus irregularis DAOM 181602=DAOM 197198]|eukprot:XP_025172790.1 hypothetical protein GLOIN_2v1482767 [Rhizophagus irregularis DAOM 181602=DAOM 197198]
MSLKTSEESIDDIQSSDDNLKNLTEICVNEEKIFKNNVEVINTLKDVNEIDKDNFFANDEDTLKDVNEINKDNSLANNKEDTLTENKEINKDNILTNDEEEGTLKDANEIIEDNLLSNDDKKDISKDANETDKGNSLVNVDEKDTLKDTNVIDKPKQRILVCVGVPGSGKSTFSKKLCQIDHIWFRVNQDDLGSRKACEEILKAQLKKGKNVIVDRCNFDKDQRKTWINIAYHHKLSIDAIILDTPFEICEKRILNREEHPTQVHGSKGLNILETFKQMYKLPNYNEGFERILNVKPQEINDCNEDDIKNVMRKLDEIPKSVFRQGERERGERGKRRPYRGRGGESYGRASGENYQGRNFGGSGDGNSGSGYRGNAWVNRGRGGNRGSGRGGNYQRGNHGDIDDRGDTWGNRGRGGNRGSGRGGNYQRGNHGDNDDRGDTWGNRGKDNNNNSKNVPNPHYNSNFPPLGKK